MFDVAANNAFLSKGINKLISFLIENKQWKMLPKDGVGSIPQFIVGFGSGGNIALHFCASEIQTGKLSLLRGSIQTLLLINCYFNVNENFQKLLHNFRKCLTYGSHTELMEFII